jgi:acetate kinase
MTDAILVLNAGSSSIKFSLFATAGHDLDLVARGQAEGLYTSPRFVAKSRHGEVVEEKKWREGESVGHDGALDHLVQFLRGRSEGYRLVGAGHRVVHG